MAETAAANSRGHISASRAVPWTKGLLPACLVGIGLVFLPPPWFVLGWSLACVAVVIVAFRTFWRTPSTRRLLAMRVGLAISTCAILAILLEAWAFTFLVHSDGFGMTLSAKRWRQKYWNPINSYGYRDVEPDEEDLRSKKLVLVVGDSFAAGYGIKNSTERFSDVLRAQLRDGWCLMNVAANGWDTRREAAAIRDFPHQVDVVVLSYYVNDISRAAEQHGALSAAIKPSTIGGRLLEKSYFGNFAYWKVYRWQLLAQKEKSYTSDLLDAYEDDAVWRTHRAELLEVVEMCKARKIDLVSVVFPSLTNIEGSKTATAKVVRLFRGHGVRTLDLANHFTGRTPSELIVHPQDAHPNEEVHREVGQMLF